LLIETRAEPLEYLSKANQLRIELLRVREETRYYSIMLVDLISYMLTKNSLRSRSSTISRTWTVPSNNKIGLPSWTTNSIKIHQKRSSHFLRKKIPKK
jgi:hypothetical protein